MGLLCSSTGSQRAAFTCPGKVVSCMRNSKVRQNYSILLKNFKPLESSRRTELVVHIGTRSIKNPLVSVRAVELLRERGYDVVHFYSVLMMYSLSVLRGCGARRVLNAPLPRNGAHRVQEAPVGCLEELRQEGHSARRRRPRGLPHRGAARRQRLPRETPEDRARRRGVAAGRTLEPVELRDVQRAHREVQERPQARPHREDT